MPELTQALLLMDTCGERASLALVLNGAVAGTSVLGERAASSALLQAVRGLLRDAGMEMAQLTAVGIVNGPGSFTGLRVGLAVAKGMCEAASLPLAAVSRLAVLAAAGKLQDGFAVLRAGRDEVYVRDEHPGGPASEVMVQNDHLAQLLAGRPLVYAEESLTPVVGHMPGAQRVALDAGDALALVQASFALGGADLASLDASYVRNEQAIYRRQQATG